MPPMLIAALILLIIFAWFVIGEQKSFTEKVVTLLVFLAIYLTYRLLNGATLQQALVDPIISFFNR
ncbi:MAG TPA: hypothetical protein VI749_02380 [Candidatus Omnitrophota bacterium]|nr:hypothetical protein [Candidatus Omnitrophota bacterium]